MGIGASVGKNPRTHSGLMQDDPNRTPQDDAMSYKGKVGALRMIINSDGSKSALLKYLHEKGMESILTWYFDMDELKRCRKENLLMKAIEIRHRYDPASHNEINSNPIMIEIWNSVNETLPLPTPDSTTLDEIEIFKNLKIAQDYVFSILSKDLDSFLQSTWYTEFESIQHDQDLVSARNHKSTNSGGGKSTSVNGNGSRNGSATAFTGAKTHNNKAVVELSQHFKSKHQNVLIVDDSPASSKSIAIILESNGHRVRQANHGRIALEIITSSKFGFVLIDMSLKTMDPFEVARRIKLWEHDNVLNKSNNCSGYNSRASSSSIGSPSISQNPLRKMSDPSVIAAASIMSISSSASGASASNITGRSDSPQPVSRLPLKRMSSAHVNIPVIIIGLLMHNQHIKENKDFDYFIASNHHSTTGGINSFSIDQLYEILKAHDILLAADLEINPVVVMTTPDVEQLFLNSLSY